MINFGYIGHDIVLDGNLKENISRSIRELLSKDKEFNFYFLEEDQFSTCIYETVRQIKNDRSDLTINIILVEAEVEDTRATFKFDKTVTAPNVKKNAHFIVNIRRAQRWIIAQADYLLTYLYTDICLEDKRLLNFINKRVNGGKMILLDLTEPETLSIIRAQRSKLPASQRNVYEKMLSGIPGKEIAKEKGISSARVCQIYRISCSKLRIYTHCAVRKKYDLLAIKKETSSPLES